ncbi:MAG: enoyl-CoA hydratase/isomerase family protein [Planctomycetes bacterium]|nr:enoyl-CoA hydratase/isomerase family protein [Planctomycetota bacterium]
MPLATLDITDRVATLTLRREEMRNALSIDLLRDLHAGLDQAAAAPGITVLVLAGAGKAFCAGMDLKAVLDDPAAPGILLHSLADLTLKIRALPCVTLARVQGAAIGGGCGLACVCDIAITHADSKMGYPEVDLGVCPAVVAPWLVRKIGAGRARRVLLSGGLMSGQAAFDIGMVDHVVPTAAELDAAAAEIAKRLATGGPHALRATKELLNQLDGSDDSSLVKRGADLSARIVGMEETRTMLRAKLGK